MQNQKLIPFLSFTGQAEEAMNFYAKVLPSAKIESIVRFEKGYPNSEEGKVLNGMLSFQGQSLMFMDMSTEYPAPAFSYATSFYVNCKDEAEFDSIFLGLSEGGTVMMGPEAVMNIRKCAWITDKYGVTWQPVWE